MNLNHSLILASASPRRKEILEKAGLKFIVKSKSVTEDYPTDLPPHKVAEYLAEKKAEAFRSELIDEVVITADTTVIIDDNILGKPADVDEAFSMLSQLSGKKHNVVTGVCLMNNDKKIIFSDLTEVYFRKLSEQEIRSYITDYQPFDKAGAYGIQEKIGLTGITKIVGSYWNVVGLPIEKLYGRLQSFLSPPMII